MKEYDLLGRPRSSSKGLRLGVYLLCGLSVTVPRDIFVIILSIVLIMLSAILIFGFCKLIYSLLLHDEVKIPEYMIFDEYVEPSEWWDYVAVIIIGLYLLFYARIWLLGLCGW